MVVSIPRPLRSSRFNIQSAYAAPTLAAQTHKPAHGSWIVLPSQTRLSTVGLMTAPHGEEMVSTAWGTLPAGLRVVHQ